MDIFILIISILRNNIFIILNFKQPKVSDKLFGILNHKGNGLSF